MQRIRMMVLGAALGGAVLGTWGGPLEAQEPEPSREELDQRVRVLERKLELAEEKKAEEKKTATSVGAGKDGFAIKSASGDFQLKLRGYVQVDGRYYADDTDRPLIDNWTVRRARPVVEGTLFRIFDFKIMPDFGGGQSLLYDGYVEARFDPAAKLRVGKFKPPLGLERLQSAVDMVFVERAAPTLLVPNRDVGVQLGGEFAGGRLDYAVGLFNGAIDGALADTTPSDAREVDARLFWRPFQPAGSSPTPIDLGIGLGLSRGDQQGTVAAPQLPSFRTTGAQNFFSYRSDGSAAGTSFADGERTRLAPQAWFYTGPFGALAEYTVSEQRVRRGGVASDIANEAWQLQLSWVLTGESNSFRGVAPARAFDWSGGARGAWIVAARVSELSLDDEAFPFFADPARAASKAQLASAGVSWNLTRGIRWLLNYDHTRFDGGAADGDRPDEKLLVTRFQISF